MLTRWRWLWALLLAAIPTVSLTGNALLSALRGAFGDAQLLALLATLIAAFAGAALPPVVRFGRANHWAWLGAGAAACTLLLASVPAGPRWMHIVLFVPFGWTSQRAWGGWLALLAVALVGTSDETLQYALSYRTGSVVDVAANTTAGAGGIALARAAAAARRPPRVGGDCR